MLATEANGSLAGKLPHGKGRGARSWKSVGFGGDSFPKVVRGGSGFSKQESTRWDFENGAVYTPSRGGGLVVGGMTGLVVSGRSNQAKGMQKPLAKRGRLGGKCYS